MRHPALTHCNSHTLNTNTLRCSFTCRLSGRQRKGLWRAEKRVTLACMRTDNEWLGPLRSNLAGNLVSRKREWCDDRSTYWPRDDRHSPDFHFKDEIRWWPNLLCCYWTFGQLKLQENILKWTTVNNIHWYGSKWKSSLDKEMVLFHTSPHNCGKGWLIPISAYTFRVFALIPPRCNDVHSLLGTAQTLLYCLMMYKKPIQINCLLLSHRLGNPRSTQCQCK